MHTDWKLTSLAFSVLHNKHPNKKDNSKVTSGTREKKGGKKHFPEVLIKQQFQMWKQAL